MCSIAAKIVRGCWNQNRGLKVNPPRFPNKNKEHIMRGVLLWLVGIPIPIIILLYLFNVV